MPKCPHCPAEYSTDEELARHAEAVSYHYPQRLRDSAKAFANVAQVVDAAIVFVEDAVGGYGGNVWRSTRDGRALIDAVEVLKREHPDMLKPDEVSSGSTKE